MRRLLLGGLLALPLALAPGLLAEALHPKDLTYPSLSFEPVSPRRVVTRQGITLILLEDHELPLVDIQGSLRVGDHLDPADKLGLAALTATVARVGGAGRWSSSEMDEELEFRAAHVELGASTESTTLSASGLSRDLDLLLEAVKAVLTKPRFEEARLEVERKKRMEAVRRSNDNPGQIARRELYEVMYGEANTWGRSETLDTLKAITRADLVAFHRKHYVPGGLILGVAGDFDADEMVKKIEALFSDWKPGKVAAPPKPSPQAPRPGIYHVQKDLEQATIRMGHKGLERQNPDYFACLVMNRILGMGTFTSRMGIEIRSNRGLAYSVGSGIFEGGGPGPFIAVAQTKAASTHEVIGLMKEIIAGMGAGDITDKELEDAKNTLLNQWVFEFDSPSKIVSTRVGHEFHGYPADYLKEYPRKIEAVTAADVVRCARKYLRTEDLQVFVVGDEGRIGKPLSDLGSVTKVTLPKYD